MDNNNIIINEKVTVAKSIKKQVKYNVFQKIVRFIVFGAKEVLPELVSTLMIASMFIISKLNGNVPDTVLTWIGVIQGATGLFLLMYGIRKNNGTMTLIGLANLAFVVLDLYLKAN